MKFGIHFQIACGPDQAPASRYSDTIAQAVRAEALGFESVWPVEQHFDAATSAMPSPLLLLAAIAASTTRLRLGTAVVLLPLHHPLRVAEDFATLDVLSNGRVECGVGRGMDPSHFGGYAVAPAESAARLEEGIAMVRAAWTSQPTTYAGRFHRIDGVTLAPLPVQRPHPPIRVAANSPDTMRMAGRLGLPILVASHVNTFSGLRTMLTAYRAAQAEAGVVPGPDDVTVLAPTFTAPTVPQLRRAVTPGIDFVREAMQAKISTWLAATPAGAGADEARMRLQTLAASLDGLTFDTMAADRAILDTPDALADRLAAVGDDLGADRVICWFNMGGRSPHGDVVRAMETFADAVVRVPAPV